METRLLNILLVDDDEVDVMNVRRAFKKNNILNPLFVAGNGEEALAMLARVLSEPAAMFARAVKAVGDKQGGGDVAAEAPAEAEPA